MESAGTKIKRIIRLDGRCMRDRTSTHEYLKKKFGFPEYYGNNLDALYDLLTELSWPVKVILTHSDALTDQQPDYGKKILRVLELAEKANPHVCVDRIKGSDPSLERYHLRIPQPDH